MDQELSACLNCSWQGDAKDLEEDFEGEPICPRCGSTRVYKYEPESDGAELDESNDRV